MRGALAYTSFGELTEGDELELVDAGGVVRAGGLVHLARTTRTPTQRRRAVG